MKQNGRTPLDAAVTNNSSEVAELLSGAGASLGTCTIDVTNVTEVRAPRTCTVDKSGVVGWVSG